MIRRLYIDNFRCLSKFELELAETNILLGANGTGKTSVLGVLRRIQDFIVHGLTASDIFAARHVSIGCKEALQRFEIDLSADGVDYRYSLAIEHDRMRGSALVHGETLFCDGRLLLECQLGESLLYDDHEKRHTYPIGATRSALSFLSEQPDIQKIFRFKKEIANCVFVRPFPPLFRTESRAEDEFMHRSMSNFVDWYRHAVQENMGAVPGLFAELADVLPGFESINLAESGEARVLKVRYRASGGPKDYRFGDLSDGQRALIALYSLVFLPNRRISLFIDEPDNYLALREIQPWAAAVTERCGESLEQLVVISHHPVMIDYLAGTVGKWFSRQQDGPVRVSDEPEKLVDGLTLSETITRGWHE